MTWCRLDYMMDSRETDKQMQTRCRCRQEIYTRDSRETERRRDREAGRQAGRQASWLAILRFMLAHI
jgi:C4-dicarboxylate-specific signal transduction histidine kinase